MSPGGRYTATSPRVLLPGAFFCPVQKLELLFRFYIRLTCKAVFPAMGYWYDHQDFRNQRDRLE